MSNWLAAIVQVSGGFFHDLVMFRKARKMSLVAASSLGKCPRFFNTLRSCICKLSMAGGVDDLSHLRRITVKGDDLLPISAPAETFRKTRCGSETISRRSSDIFCPKARLRTR